MGGLVPFSGSARRAAQRDRDGLETIERQWLASEHDSATLGRILAADFLHPVQKRDLGKKQG